MAVRRRPRFNRYQLTTAIIFLVALGIVIFSLRAAAPSAGLSTASGTVTSPAQVVADSTATGGAAVQFRAAGGGGTVDTTTLAGKLMMGFQGWFFCPGDGSPMNQWVHWFRGSTSSPTTDFWPDTSELPAAEKCDTGLKKPDGTPAYVYSDWRQATVVRQFKWMADNGIDGVMLQRFVNELSGGIGTARMQVARNVVAGAEQYGRTYTIMYDISGAGSNWESLIENDWKTLVDNGIVTDSRYLHHRGKPLVVIWGTGFSDRPATIAQTQAMINFFHNNPTTKYQASVMGGVPTNWRTQGGGWSAAYYMYDVIQPWTVGRFADNAGADNYYNNTANADLADARAHGVDFMPVVFPGFSWHNLNGGPVNQIPRRGGDFYWHQVYDAVKAGNTTIYGAMFDEYDEGTVMNKAAPTQADVPSTPHYVTLDVDGIKLNPDWYLRLAGQATKMLRKDIPLTQTVPISPP